MTKDNLLAILLRVIGISGLLAVGVLFVPMSSMAAVHAWLGLGEMPISPIVAYLARSVSAFYALVGALMLVLAADIERYRPAIRTLGVLIALVGVALTAIDLTAGMPLWWSIVEGPATIGGGVVIFYLAR